MNRNPERITRKSVRTVKDLSADTNSHTEELKSRTVNGADRNCNGKAEKAITEKKEINLWNRN